MKAVTSAKPNTRLRQLREQRHLTQTELARLLGTTYLSVCRWENGTTSPSMYYRKRLCELFNLTPAELGLVPLSKEASPADPADAPPPARIWHVPYRRNPFFTGREAILARLHTLLNAGSSVVLSQVYAISGLGGIGKTQTAVEFAYRHRADYTAILWLRAESREVLEADIVSVAQALHLPEYRDHQYAQILRAVQNWLHTHERWLLLLDNVEDIGLVEEVLPTDHQGHIFLTTRSQATGAFIQRLDLETMSQEDGALFLLRRAKLLAPDAPLESSSAAQSALELSQLLDGLPLALDQAGAYIEETGCSLTNYIQRYYEHRATLLNRRGQPALDHPASVGATLALSFEMVARLTPAVLELLRFCAFLSPDAIPEELVQAAANSAEPEQCVLTSDALALDEAFAALQRYSLLRRHAEARTFTMHRLVQAVLKTQMPVELQKHWATHSVRAVNQCVPFNDFPSDELVRRFLPHARACAVLIDEYQLHLPEAGQLLSKTGKQLMDYALFAEAEPLLKQALAIQETQTEHSDRAATLSSLGDLKTYIGRYEEAEPLFLRALAIREQALGAEHAETASTLDSLGVLYIYQGRFNEAEPVLQRALSINERVLGPQHLDTGGTLNNLALLYMHLKRYEEGEQLYKRVIALHEHLHKTEQFFHTVVLDNLGKLYYFQGRYAEARELYLRALAIEERTIGLQHSCSVITLHNLGLVYHAQGDYEQAERYYQQSLENKQQLFGEESPGIAETLGSLAKLYQESGRSTQAADLYCRALKMKERTLGPEHPSTIETREEWNRQL